jgi:large subunit ribosomal protein L19
MNKLQIFEKQQIEKLSSIKPIPNFGVGDTLRIGVKVIDVKVDSGKDKKKKTDKKSENQTKERIQSFEGVLIAKKNSGVNSCITVRKVSNGEGVERLFKIYSPNVASIEIIKKGSVRRAKLYYLRKLSGKNARIKEKLASTFGVEVVKTKNAEQEVTVQAE